MKKIVILALSVMALVASSNVMGQDPIKTSVIRKGSHVQFLTVNAHKDTLVKIKGRGVYDYQSIETGTAEVFVLALTSQENLTDSEFIAMYYNPSQSLLDKRFNKKERIIERGTWQSGFFMDRVMLSYKIPIIDRTNMTIYAAPRSEEVLSWNMFMLFFTIFLIAILMQTIFIVKFLRFKSYPVIILFVEAVVISALSAVLVAPGASVYAVIVTTAIGYFGKKRLKEELRIFRNAWQGRVKKTA